MLYNTTYLGKDKEEFIFDAEPYNEDIDLRLIADLQRFYEKNGYIPEKYISEFLNWITYSARKNIVSGVETPYHSSLSGRCGTAQSYNDKMLEKLNLNRIAFNVGRVLGKENIHALECVEIPTMINGEIIKKLYILDPTFRQFCIKSENRFERYYEEPKWAVRMSTPHPGYFLNLTEAGKNFANNLIRYGYFEVTEQNLKTYFDAFSLYVTPKEAYPNPNLIGKTSNTSASAQDYWNMIIKNIEKPLSFASHNDIETPKELQNKEDRKILNQIQHILKGEQKVEYSFAEETKTK